MKDKLFTLMVVIVGITLLGAITYDQKYYTQNREFAFTNSTGDPLYQFIGEVEDIIEDFGLEGGTITLDDDENLTFGDDDDVTIEYDEDGDDDLQFVGEVSFETSVLMPYEVVTAANTITHDEAGKVFFLNSATEFQTILPTVSGCAGMTVRFVIRAAPAGANYTIITGNTTEDVLYGMVLEAETDTTEDGPVIQDGDTITFVQAVAVIGDWVELTSDGTYWYVSGMTAADGGVTLTDSD